jgi:hypothetical protein
MLETLLDTNLSVSTWHLFNNFDSDFMIGETTATKADRAVAACAKYMVRKLVLSQEIRAN